MPEHVVMLRFNTDGTREYLKVAQDALGLQDALGGGYAELVMLPVVLADRGLVGIADEEGLLKELPYNPYSRIILERLVGPVLIARSDPPEFVNLTDDDRRVLKQWTAMYDRWQGRRS